MISLEKLQRDYFRIELQDWGSFYYLQDPLFLREDQDEWLRYDGYWVSPEGNIIPAILEKFIQIDGENLEKKGLFLFQVLSKDFEVLTTNI